MRPLTLHSADMRPKNQVYRDTVDAERVARAQARVRRRVLAAYCRHGVLSEEDAKDMAAWGHGGGFSVDASVGIAPDDRAALDSRRDDSRRH